MAKLDQLAASNKGAAQSVPRSEMFGLVAKVVTFAEKDGKADLTVEVMIDSGSLKAGDQVKAYFTPTSGKDIKCMETLKRNMGRAANSVLMMENCSLDAKGAVVSQWLKQVAISASKVAEGDERSMKRSILSGYMDQPVISFRNPSQVEGEPQTIRWPFTATKAPQWVVRNGKGEELSFDRAWAVGKLQDVLRFNKDGTKGVYIRTNVYDADKSVRANSIAELRDSVVAHLSENNNNEVVLRVSDGSAVWLRSIRNKFLGAADGMQAPERTVDDTFSRDLFGRAGEDGTWISVNNADLDAAVASGDLVLEMIPAHQVPYNGDVMQSTKSVLVKKFAEQTVENIREFSVPFGIDAAPGVMVKMAVPTEPFASGEVYMAGSPMALSRQVLTLESLPTPHFGGVQPEAGVQEENDVFDASQFDLVPEEAADTPAEAAVAEAPVEEAAPVAQAEPTRKQSRKF